MKKKPGHRYFYHLTGLLFGIFILVVLVINLILPDRGFSQKENRVLASRPALGISQLTSGKFADDYETYVNDQFFFRDWWITLRATTQRVLGMTEGNGVFLGKSGYLMEDFTAPTEERFNRTIDAMKDFAARHEDLKQYALIAPNAVSILSDKLPALAPATDQNPYLDATRSALEEAGVTFVDVRDALSRHKDDGIYYHTDHHWTTQGAYFAYLELAKFLGIDSSQISYDKLPVSKSFQGTLSAKSGFRASEKEEMDVFLPRTENVPSSVVNYVDEQKKTASFYETSQLETRDKYALFFNGNHSKVIISTPVEENRTLLVIKDSYANSLVPFLAPYYRKIVLVDPRYFYGDLEELIQVENIQEVLYLYNANTFYSDTSLELALTPDENSSTADSSADSANENTNADTPSNLTESENSSDSTGTSDNTDNTDNTDDTDSTDNPDNTDTADSVDTADSTDTSSDGDTAGSDSSEEN